MTVVDLRGLRVDLDGCRGENNGGGQRGRSPDGRDVMVDRPKSRLGFGRFVVVWGVMNVVAELQWEK